MSWGYFRKYVPVAQRKAHARAFARQIAAAQGRQPLPVEIQGQKIAKTFWGNAWCEHLESYSDFANRLPRGRTYARNGSVVDLVISPGQVEAIVGGSDVYEIEISIDRLKAKHWKQIRNDCAESIDSLLDLLGGRFSDGVMQRLTRRGDGLFPSPREIRMSCSCPDWAGLCKHLAAVLYGVGAHLDQQPELLFRLRDVDHTQLVNEAVSEGNLTTAFGEPSQELTGEDLGAMFGIDLDSTDIDAALSASETRTTKPAARKKASRSAKAKKKHAKKAARTKVTKKKAPGKKTARKKVPGKKPVKKKPLKKKAGQKNTSVRKTTKKAALKKKAVKKKAVKTPATGKKTASQKASQKQKTPKKKARRRK